MEFKFRKADFILICIILIVSGVLFFFHQLADSDNDATVVVQVDGKTVGTYSLNENVEVEINNSSNTLVIKDGSADMVLADCPDKLCVHQKAISKNNESIICLPNKVVVTIISDDEADYDTVVN